MFDINKYEDVFDPRFKYAEAVRENIDQRRIALGGLFVDKILLLLPDIKRRKSSAITHERIYSPLMQQARHIHQK